MNSKNITLNAQTVRDLIAAHLYAMGEVHDNLDIVEIKYNPEALNNETLMALQYKTKKHQEVKRKTLNG